MMLKGNISEGELQELKAAFPPGTLCRKPLDKGKADIVFRIMTADMVEELKKLIRDGQLKNGGEIPLEEANLFIFQNCVVWPELGPEDYETIHVGIIPSVVKSIQEKSGFVDVDILGRPLGPDVSTSIVKEFPYWKDIAKEEFDALKEEYPQFEIHRVRTGRFIFYVRPMTRTDIRVANQSQDRSLALARAVTLWPKEVPWEIIGAGYIENLGEAANAVSGWDQEAEVEEV